MSQSLQLSAVVDRRPTGPLAIPGLGFRPETETDLPFLTMLYASTRAAELARVDWTDLQKSQFIAMQFDLQRRYYRHHFPAAAFDIITCGHQDVGRCYVERRDVITVIDMALLPAWCGQGRGSAILRSLQDEAARSDRAIVLHVEHDNPAARLYARFGFHDVGSNGIYRTLRWRSGAAPVQHTSHVNLP